MNEIRRFLARYPASGLVSDPLVIVPTFNNGPYLQNCLSQLQKLGLKRYLIFDGGSSDPETVSIVQRLVSEDRAIIFPDNPGPRHFFENKSIYSELPEVFCVTDPDLEFNSDLPEQFTNRLYSLGVEKRVGKVGLALSIEGQLREEEFFFGKKWRTIRQWESQFWLKPITNSLGLEAYDAPIDTTFALYNKKFLGKNDFFKGIRVAGEFTARHLPWYTNSASLEDERRSDQISVHSTWNKTASAFGERRALENALKKIEEMESSFSWKITAPLRMFHRVFLKLRGTGL